jgi:hypothetical protein
MFRGFSGIIQADAHTIYDSLFRGEAFEEGASPPTEAACYFLEAAIAHHRVGKEGLLRINAIFEQEYKGSGLPPSKRPNFASASLHRWSIPSLLGSPLLLLKSALI